MKPLFGIDLTANKKNEEANGKQFSVRTVDRLQMQAYEQHVETLDATLERTKLPLALRVIKAVCGYAALLAAVVLVRLAFDLGLAQAYERTPFLFFATPVLALVWLALMLLSHKKATGVLGEEATQQQTAALDRDVRSHYEALGVPADAVQMDVLMFRYKVKNDKVQPRALGFAPTPFAALEMMAFATENELLLADMEELYSIPKAALRRITTVKKRICILNWNKEEAPNKGRFKPYKITVNNAGLVYFKPYYVMEFEADGEPWGIYLPSYERETFERLTGLHTEE